MKLNKHRMFVVLMTVCVFVLIFPGIVSLKLDFLFRPF